MSRPDKCQYCECSDVASDHNYARRFLCGTIWNIEHQSWECCINCARRCVVPLMELRQRVATAVAAIDAVTTYRLEKDDYGAWLKGASDGIWMDRLEVENVKKILQGNNPEIPEGSEGTIYER